MKEQIETALTILTMLLMSTGSVAETPEQKELREMQEIQRLLNAQVMAKPFGVEEMSRIDAYIEKSMKAEVKPKAYDGPQVWLPGMTCAHLRGYYLRRNCRYYYAYYGRYYPYYP